MGKINTDNYPNRPFSSYQDDDMFVLQDNGGETYTTNVGDIKNLADSRIKLEGVQVNGTDLPITNKKVNVDISGKTDLSVIAYTFNSEMGYFKGAYVTYNGKLYEFIQEHTGAWNPSHVREIRASGQYVRTGNGGYNNGDRATCEGYMTKASGNYSHAEGRETQAVGECTHAEGRETIANSIYQHVEGKYNIADNESKYVHIIGNGIDDNNRSNALTLDWEGNLTVSGDVEDGNGEKISDKADKVSSATSGHLAGLDSNGNLTDSGVSPTEEVTVEGNPVTFDSPFEQDAKSVVVSVKPIQAGSGTPSPENIRPISGIDEVEIGVSDGESEPTTTTIPLPSTLYGGTVDVTEGSAVDGGAIVTYDENDEWYLHSSGRFYVNRKPSNMGDRSVNSAFLSNGYVYEYEFLETVANKIFFGGTGLYVGKAYESQTLEEFKAYIKDHPLQVKYPLATPTTLSFDPADVELLEGTNVVTTNAEKVAVTYGRSLWQDIDDLKTDTEGKLDKSDVATIEGDTASKAYSVNDFMLRSDGLYKVTQPIASGASITASNTTKTTIGAVLTALLNA